MDYAQSATVKCGLLEHSNLCMDKAWSQQTALRDVKDEFECSSRSVAKLAALSAVNSLSWGHINTPDKVLKKAKRKVLVQLVKTEGQQGMFLQKNSTE